MARYIPGIGFIADSGHMVRGDDVIPTWGGQYVPPGGFSKLGTGYQGPQNQKNLADTMRNLPLKHAQKTIDKMTQLAELGKLSDDMLTNAFSPRIAKKLTDEIARIQPPTKAEILQGAYNDYLQALDTYNNTRLYYTEDPLLGIIKFLTEGLPELPQAMKIYGISVVIDRDSAKRYGEGGFLVLKDDARRYSNLFHEDLNFFDTRLAKIEELMQILQNQPEELAPILNVFLGELFKLQNLYTTARRVRLYS